MPGMYAAEEAIRFAIEAERCGQAFYEQLETAARAETVRFLCQDLARQEVEHARQFEKLLARVREAGWIRPATWDELALAQSLIQERLLPDEATARQMAARAASDLEAIEIAIQLEKQSILFYTEMLDMTETRGRPVVEEILQAEKLHLRRLIELKQTLKEHPSR